MVVQEFCAARANVARVAHDRYRAGSVMVWGEIIMTGKTKAGLQDCTIVTQLVCSLRSTLCPTQRPRIYLSG